MEAMKKIMALLAIGLALPVQADVIEVYLYPKYIHQPDQHILVQNGRITAESQAVDKLEFLIRHMGENAAANEVTWDVSRYTGFQPRFSLNNFQRGEFNDGPPIGTNAFQIQGYEAGCMINTWSFDWIPVAGGGPHCALQYKWDTSLDTVPRPWTVEESSLAFQFLHKLPWHRKSGSNLHQAVAQSNMVIYVEDKNGVSVGIVVALFDPRPSYEEFVSNDTYTAFASAPLLDGQTYISKSPYSHGYSSQPFAEARFTRVHITRQNLENIIEDVNAQGLLLDEDVAGYKLHSVLWQTEIGGYSTTDNVSIGTSISHMVVLSCTGLQC